MKIILLADVYKHGVAGEVIEVADGYARNWLIPKKLAVKATKGELRKAEKLRAQSEMRRAALDERLNDLARQIDGTELFFGRRASPTGKLFGSVTTTEIAEALMEKTGLDINRRRISQTSLREIGTHEVPIRLGSDNPPTLRITIVRAEEFNRYMEERAAVEAAAKEAAERGEDTAALYADAEGADAEAPAEAAAAAEAAVAEATESAPPATDTADAVDDYDDVPPATDLDDAPPAGGDANDKQPNA
ncbi:MAG: 50S ribosomal protein L9 [Chloroflexi bacterium]|nr:50S ribosomal protein L9 [Chloroflexota bacterium]